MTQTAETNVLVLLGSLRAASVNRQIAGIAADNAPSGVHVTLYEGLADVPFYNEDIDVPADGSDAPAAAVALREAVAAADAILVVTPEYNGTIPAVLKNAIDWLSRPYGDSALKDRPLAVIGAALGQYGGVWAHDETRKSIGIAGAHVLDSISLSVPVKALDGKHPAENAELVSNVRAVLEKLAAEVS